MNSVVGNNKGAAGYRILARENKVLSSPRRGSNPSSAVLNAYESFHSLTLTARGNGALIPARRQVSYDNRTSEECARDILNDDVDTTYKNIKRLFRCSL